MLPRTTSVVALGIFASTSAFLAPGHHGSLSARLCLHPSDGHCKEIGSRGLSVALRSAAGLGEAEELLGAVQLDWSFIDKAYIITCPNADQDGSRMKSTSRILEDVGLWDRIEVKEFDTDDENRIRGCYMSHISVLQDAKNEFARRTNGNPLGGVLSSIFSRASDRYSSDDDDARRILVVEDNLALTSSISQDAIDKIAKFSTEKEWDMIHLSYIPYVPDLKVSRTDYDGVVSLTTGSMGSALGTTAYIINLRGIDTILAEHEANGFFAPIPDVMAKLFPSSRYASYPSLFVRAPTTRSLVNPQLDDLRQLLFRPAVASFAQNLLVWTGLPTNSLLPIVVGVLMLASVVSAKLTTDAIWSLATTGVYSGPILVPILSSLFTMFSLAVIAQGAMLAPKPAAETKQDIQPNSV